MALLSGKHIFLNDRRGLLNLFVKSSKNVILVFANVIFVYTWAMLSLSVSSESASVLHQRLFLF